MRRDAYVFFSHFLGLCVDINSSLCNDHITNTGSTMTTATPTKLNNGNWGARVNGTINAGDTVTITTRSGKSWEAKVDRVLSTSNGVSICATAKVATKSAAPTYRRTSKWCDCGLNDDMLSFGYMPGARIRCEDCGGIAVAS